MFPTSFFTGNKDNKIRILKLKPNYFLSMDLLLSSAHINHFWYNETEKKPKQLYVFGCGVPASLFKLNMFHVYLFEVDIQ